MEKQLAVIINTCNRPYLLKTAVEQIMEQTKDGDKIIIVNDGEEGTLPELQGEDICKIEHCKPYYALASARNAGLNKALDLGYDWGVFVDDDIEVVEGWLDTHRKAWTDKEIMYAGKILGSANSSYDIRTVWAGEEGKLGDGEVPKDFLVQMGGCNFGCYLPSLAEVGGFNERFDGNYGYEDVELAYRLTQVHGWDVEYLSDAAMLNRQAPPSGDYVRNISENREKIVEIVPKELMWDGFE